MPQYAQFDSTRPAPSSVIGWYDTDLVNYANLPAEADLLLLTEEQWNARLTNPSGWAVSNGALISHVPPAPDLTLEQQAALELAARINNGIAITCSTPPDVSATYALDTVTLNQVGSVARDFSSGLGLPGDIDTFTYPDATGMPRTMTGDQLTAIYRKMRNLLSVLNTQSALMAHGGTPQWPDQTATIP